MKVLGITAGVLGTILMTLLMGCKEDPSSAADHTDVPDTPAEGVADGCGSVRMTQYASSERRWCGFDRTSAILPDFVQQGMTVAVAEPWNGGSYGGEAGEACGECWELSTGFATQMVMVHDLCPIEGNPICAGSHFHFDVASEVANKVDGGQWLGEATVRRVPCPVSGNIHVYMTARNQWGYMKIAFFNHRFPIRTVEYRAVDGSEWLSMTRCLARWCLEDDKTTFAENGPGGIFRLTSATGEQVETTEVLTWSVLEKSEFNTGVQFAEVAAMEGACRFSPPAQTYVDEWGGIDGVRWEPNTFGNTVLLEIHDNCAENSVSCLRLSSFDGSGVHMTYRHTFPVDTFDTITLQLRSDTGTGTVEVAPRSEESRCSAPPTFSVNRQWQSVTVSIADSCPDVDWIHGLTISRSTDVEDLFIDNIVFQLRTSNEP